MSRVLVCESFDDLRSRDVRFLQEASRVGAVHALAWSDAAVRRLTGEPPKFPQEERLYLLRSIRYVSSASISRDSLDPDEPQWPQPVSERAPLPSVWVVMEREDSGKKREHARFLGIEYRTITDRELAGFPDDSPQGSDSGAASRRVVVTGCYDWFHSGHVRFFEEVSALGALTVILGKDENVRFLKGEGHPLFPQDERRYLVASVRFVTAALVATGMGWLDAEPEIRAIRPQVYAVNEDGDKPEKRDFCRDNGMEYVVLKREPRPGLPQRTSTNLRGF
jgi:cytidyltransferase-like protein